MFDGGILTTTSTFVHILWHVLGGNMTRFLIMLACCIIFISVTVAVPQEFLLDQTLPGGTLRASIRHITWFVQMALHLPCSWPQLELRELTQITVMSCNPSTSLTGPQNNVLTSTILATLNYFTVDNCLTPFYVLSLPRDIVPVACVCRNDDVASLQQQKYPQSITANIEHVLDLVISNSILVLGGHAGIGSDTQSDTIAVLSGALALMKGTVRPLCNDQGSVIMDTFLSVNGDAVVIERLATPKKLTANSAWSVRQNFFHGIVPPTSVTVWLLIKPCQWMKLQFAYDDNPFLCEVCEMHSTSNQGQLKGRLLALKFQVS